MCTTLRKGKKKKKKKNDYARSLLKMRKAFLFHLFIYSFVGDGRILHQCVFFFLSRTDAGILQNTEDYRRRFQPNVKTAHRNNNNRVYNLSLSSRKKKMEFVDGSKPHFTGKEYYGHQLIYFSFFFSRLSVS